MRLVVAAISVAVGQLPHLLVSNQDPATHSYDFVVSYSTTDGRCPDSTMQEVPFHDNQQIRAAQCFIKCSTACGDATAGTCTVPGCSAFDPAVHTSGSNVLCFEFPGAATAVPAQPTTPPATETDALALVATGNPLELLCTQVEDCYAYELVGDASGYLYHSSCEGQIAVDTTSPTAKTMVKAVAATPQCPLGVAASVSGSAYAVLDGLYERDHTNCGASYPDPNVDIPPNAPCTRYIQLNTAQPNVITWHQSHCGWAVMRDMATTAAEPPADAPCADHVEEANYALKQTGVDSDPNVCVASSAAGYCGNSMLAMVCPVTCAFSACSDDNQNAAKEYFKMVTGDYAAADEPCADPATETASCCGSIVEMAAAGGSEFQGCEDLLLATLCPGTCPAASRRLQESTAPAISGFARALRSTTRQLARRLGRDMEGGDFLEHYYTFDPFVLPTTNAAPDCTATNTDAQRSMIDDGKSGMFDTFQLHEAAATQTSITCPQVVKYTHVYERYCKHNNVQAPFHRNREVVQNQCTSKCTYNRDIAISGFTLNTDGDRTVLVPQQQHNVQVGDIVFFENLVSSPVDFATSLNGRRCAVQDITDTEVTLEEACFDAAADTHTAGTGTAVVVLVEAAELSLIKRTQVASISTVSRSRRLVFSGVAMDATLPQAVVTTLENHGLAIGDSVLLSTVSPPTVAARLNERTFTVVSATATTFNIAADIPEAGTHGTITVLSTTITTPVDHGFLQGQPVTFADVTALETGIETAVNGLTFNVICEPRQTVGAVCVGNVFHIALNTVDMPGDGADGTATGTPTTITTKQRHLFETGDMVVFTGITPADAQTGVLVVGSSLFDRITTQATITAATYTTPEQLTGIPLVTTTGTGTGATVDLTVDDNGVSAISVAVGGQGYKADDVLTVEVASITGATGALQVTLEAGDISDLASALNDQAFPVVRLTDRTFSIAFDTSAEPGDAAGTGVATRYDTAGGLTLRSRNGPTRDLDGRQLEEGWCKGTDLAELLPDTNALCLPREECERICTAVAECHSFDMHRSLPRCYLNTAECADEANLLSSETNTDADSFPSVYDVIVKRLPNIVDPLTDEVVRSNIQGSPDTFVQGGANGVDTVTQITTAHGVLVADELRDSWITHTGMQCTEASYVTVTAAPTADPSSAATGEMTRSQCELACSLDPSCLAFGIEWTCPLLTDDVDGDGEEEVVLPRVVSLQSCRAKAAKCELFNSDCKDAMGVWKVEAVEDRSGLVHFVEKVPHAACYVTVTDSIAVGAPAGVYAKVEQPCRPNSAVAADKMTSTDTSSSGTFMSGISPTDPISNLPCSLATTETVFLHENNRYRLKYFPLSPGLTNSLGETFANPLIAAFGTELGSHYTQTAFAGLTCNGWHLQELQDTEDTKSRTSFYNCSDYPSAALMYITAKDVRQIVSVTGAGVNAIVKTKNPIPYVVDDYISFSDMVAGDVGDAGMATELSGTVQQVTRVGTEISVSGVLRSSSGHLKTMMLIGNAPDPATMPADGSYNGVVVTSTTLAGTGAQFTVTVDAAATPKITVIAETPGENYADGEVVTLTVDGQPVELTLAAADVLAGGGVTTVVSVGHGLEPEDKVTLANVNIGAPGGSYSNVDPATHEVTVTSPHLFTDATEVKFIGTSDVLDETVTYYIKLADPPLPTKFFLHNGTARTADTLVQVVDNSIVSGFFEDMGVMATNAALTAEFDITVIDENTFTVPVDTSHMPGAHIASEMDLATADAAGAVTALTTDSLGNDLFGYTNAPFELANSDATTLQLTWKEAGVVATPAVLHTAGGVYTAVVDTPGTDTVPEVQTIDATGIAANQRALLVYPGAVLQQGATATWNDGVTFEVTLATDYTASTLESGMVNSAVNHPDGITVEAFVCDWGARVGRCADVVFKGLCAYSCVDVVMTMHGPDGYYHQDRTLDTDTQSTCHGDNNQAAKQWLVGGGFGFVTPYPGPTDETTTCSWLSTYTPPGGETYYNTTDSPCHFHDRSGIVAALCKTTCAGTQQPTSPPTPEPTDEATAQGSSQRRLQQLGEGGVVEAMYHVGTSADEHWDFLARTYSNGSDTSAGGCLATHGDVGLAVTDSLGAGFINAYAALEGATWYRWRAPFFAGVSMETVCRAASMCPELTTCILSDSRLKDEMHAWRRGITTTTPVSDAQFLTQMDAPTRCQLLDTNYFPPKVLVNVDRAEAIVAMGKMQYTKEVFRNDPTTTRVTLLDLGANADKVVVSLVDPLMSKPDTGAEGSPQRKVSEDQLGKSFGSRLSQYWQMWVTDVIRIERFGSDCTIATNGMFKFRVQMPPSSTVRKLKMYRVPMNAETIPDADSVTVAASAFVDIESEGGSVVGPIDEGVFEVTVTSVNADFIGAEDLYECETSNGGCGGGDPIQALCDEREGAAPTCTCRADNGYDPVPGVVPVGTECELKPKHYDTHVKDSYFRLTHGDRLDYGWRVAEVRMFATEDCSGTALSYTAADVCSGSVYSGLAADQLPAGVTATTVDTCFVKVRGTYPGIDSVMVDFLFDEQSAAVTGTSGPVTEWWSECLNCNPEVVDDTRSSAAFIEWYVSAGQRVSCVQVVQDQEHMASDLKIEMGPISGDGCGYDQDKHCEATEVWSFPDITVPQSMTYSASRAAAIAGASAQVVYMATDLPTTCGLANTQIFGELLSAPTGGDTGDGAKHFGSYAQPLAPSQAIVQPKSVPSACHCQQLCVDHMSDGCRSYKYLYEEAAGGGAMVQHCYLQITPFSIADGRWGTKTESVVGQWPGWTSGTTGLRLTGFTPHVVTPGERFTLTLHGVQLPYSKNKGQDLSSRQRIKIVGMADECTAEVPQAVKGVGCARTLRTTAATSQYRQVQGGAASSRQSVVFAHCSTRPSTADSERATFEKLSIQSVQTTQQYKVCYCDGKKARCHENEWLEVPGSITVAGSSYSWSSLPASPVLRKLGATSEVALTVKRPPFSDYRDPTSWEMKIVRHYFGCTVDHDAVKFPCNPTAGATASCTEQTVGNPNEATWTVQMVLEHTVQQSDVGLYTVCFRTDATATWEELPGEEAGVKSFEVLPLPEDRTHPRGIFHTGQVYSALAGATTSITVPGLRLVTPSDSRIALNAHADGVCGDNSRFSFNPGAMAAVSDVTPPVLMPALSSPAHGTRSNQQFTLMLTFSETVQKGTGEFYVRNTADGTTPLRVNVENPMVFFQWNRVFFAPPRATGLYSTDLATRWIPSAAEELVDGATYNIRTNKYGVVLDLDGNEVLQLDTADSYSWTMALTTNAVPKMLYTVPYHGQENVVVDSQIFIQFSEMVQATTGTFFHVVNCGVDQDCSTDEDNLIGTVDIAKFFDTTLACQVSSGIPATISDVDVSQNGAVEATVDLNGGVTGLCSGVPRTDADGAVYSGVDPGFIYFDPGALDLLQVQADHSGYRYMVSFPANVVTSVCSSDPCSGDETARGNEPFSFEFSTGAYNRFRHEYAFTATEMSTENGLVFDLALAANVVEVNLRDTKNVFKYTVCYCDEQLDLATATPVEALGQVRSTRDGETTYALSDNSRCAPATAGMITTTNMLPSVRPDLCTDKCNKGCSGPKCHCEGLAVDEGLGLETARLCLSPAQCRAACDAHSLEAQELVAANEGVARPAKAFVCLGIDVHKTANACYLLGGEGTVDDFSSAYSQLETSTWNCYSGGATETTESFLHFTKRHGSVCTHASDFKEHAGTLAVTSRVQVGVDYILDPGSDARGSIEVTVPGFTSTVDRVPLSLDATGVSRDRITVVDCHGTCGVSAPSTAVSSPTNAGDIKTWNRNWPLNYFSDPPHIDEQNVEAEGAEVVVVTPKVYTRREELFCPDHHIDPENETVHIAGVLQSLQTHQCYHKCVEQACALGDMCFCDGFLSGHDSPDSNSLCLSAQWMQYYCDRVPGCVSFDQHRTLNRGFLNMAGCEANAALLTASEDYDWYVQQGDAVDEGDVPNGGPGVVNGGGGVLVARTALEWAFSWQDVLRFREIRFSTGGSFKLCFCDSEHLSTIALDSADECRDLADYSIEVGKIHVSGISCLLSDSRFRRTICASQYYGGLRCYGAGVPQPTLTPPDVPDSLRVGSLLAAEVQGSLRTWCLFGPEETMQNDPRCKLVAAYQSAVR